MYPPGIELKSRIEKFERALKDSGMRLTHQRLEIFREVACTGDHPDAETIYIRVRSRIPTISLDTVYRNLWMLNDMGLVATFSPAKGGMRFDGNVEPHHHFVCTECGKISDFYSREFDELEVPEEVEGMGDVETAHVQFRGLCESCRDKRSNE